MLREGDDVELQWMWADAKVLPGLHFLATANPLRWSKGSVEKIREELQRYADVERPVKMRVVGGNESTEHRFANLAVALAWVDAADETDAELLNYEIPSSNPVLGIAIRFLSAPALALYLRVLTSGDATRSWSRRNIFVAYSYASRVTSVPREVAAAQAAAPQRYRQQHMPWSAWFSSPDVHLLPLLHAAQAPEANRPAEVMVDGAPLQRLADGERTNDFWVVYGSLERRVAFVALRGGDAGGRPNDAHHHSGSPLRAFVCGDDPDRVPEEILPFATLQRLGEEGFRVTIVAYSQGGIPAIACAYRFRFVSWLERVVVINAASMFWPPWMANVLIGNATDECYPIVSWVVEGDPLSDGIRDRYRAPRVVGDTYLLPTKGSGFANHYLDHFELAK